MDLIQNFNRKMGQERGDEFLHGDIVEIIKDKPRRLANWELVSLVGMRAEIHIKINETEYSIDINGKHFIKKESDMKLIQTGHDPIQAKSCFMDIETIYD